MSQFLALRKRLFQELHGNASTHCVSLHFNDDAREQSFLKDYHKQLQSNLVLTALVGFLGISITAIRHEAYPWMQAPADTEPRMWRVLADIGVMYIAAMALMAFVGLSSSRPRFLQIHPSVVEWLIVFLVMAGTGGVIFMDKWYWACMLGVPAALKPVTTDTNVLLGIDIYLTASHFFLPVRWSALAWTEAFACLIYSSVSFSYGTPYPDGFVSNNINLLIIVVLAALGRRHMERQARRWFEVNELDQRLLICRDAPLKPSSELNVIPETSVTCEFAVFSELQFAETTESTPSSLAIQAASEGSMDTIYKMMMRIGTAEQWLVRSTEVTLRRSEVLGAGGFGEVTAALYFGSRVAVKHAKVDPFFSPDRALARSRLITLCNEIRILRRVRHPHIVPMYGVILAPQSLEISIVMQRLDGCTLSKFIDNQSSSEETRLQLLIEVCSALSFLHSRQPCIIHGDLKPENIFVETGASNTSSKLLDFGLSRILTHDAPAHMGGTLRWMAPEVMCTPLMKPSPSTDVYSFGLIMFFVASGLIPFACFNPKDLILWYKKGEVPPLQWQLLPTNSLVENCIRRCTERLPAARPLSSFVLQALCNQRSAIKEATAPAPSWLAGEQLTSLSAGEITGESLFQDDCFAQFEDLLVVPRYDLQHKLEVDEVNLAADGVGSI